MSLLKVKVWNPRLWPSRLALRYVAVMFIALFLMVNFALWHNTRIWNVQSPPKPIGKAASKHPIRKLMLDAKAHHEATLAKQSHNLATAAAQYRRRRGRHPPPGFDSWFQHAQITNSIVVEDYFDRIYKDLTPFWGLDPEQIKARQCLASCGKSSQWYRSRRRRRYRPGALAAALDRARQRVFRAHARR
jgi:hypothetical protein